MALYTIECRQLGTVPIDDDILRGDTDRGQPQNREDLRADNNTR